MTFFVTNGQLRVTSITRRSLAPDGPARHRGDGAPGPPAGRPGRVALRSELTYGCRAAEVNVHEWGELR